MCVDPAMARAMGLRGGRERGDECEEERGDSVVARSEARREARGSLRSRLRVNSPTGGPATNGK